MALTFQEKMFAGAIARGIAQTVLHPVDVIRTRLQARYISSTWKPSIFIKGVIPQISLAIPAGAIQFLAFEAAKEKLATLLPDERLSQTRTLIAGALGALAAASCRIPQEVLKQRIQADIYPNVFVALQQTIGKQGIASLYKGSLATISRDVPWNALSFMFHGQGKKIFEKIKGRPPQNDENLAVAGVAGAVAAIIMTPVDVVKTRIMTQRPGVQQYTSIIGTLQKIVAEEGAGTLMKGVLPRILFLAPLAGITFSVYEAVAANIKKRKSMIELQPDATAMEDTNKLRKKKNLFTLRFAKQPVYLANSALSKEIARTTPVGTYLGDYTAANPIFFSLSS